MVEVEIPKDQRAWFSKHRSVPARVEIQGSKAWIEGAKTPYYLLREKGQVRVLRVIGSDSFELGVFTESGVKAFMSSAALKDCCLIRAALFDVPYHAPVAYQLPGKRWVHTGACFQNHDETRIVQTHYSLKEVGEYCDYCEEDF